MLIGHYATALIAKERNYDTPIWLFIAAATLPDLAMSTFVLSGIETMAPDPARPGSLFERMVVDMTFSHDLFAIGAWAFLATILVYVFARRVVAALWGGVLVAFHSLCDFVSGFEHQVAGPGTPSFGLGLYSTAPLVAVAIESLLAFACVYWFTRRMRLPRWKKTGLFLTTMLGLAAMVPNVI